ncbi:hemagglutinin [Yeosuana aromativorans]|uniref:Peptidoglycan hydrolase n=1 Tax=Yeosuana aromativorans TaxID=288019 RepID=A0A8J3BHD0_9FLAO|nr:hemagglutinin [Yeosuana aromativorans]
MFKKIVLLLLLGSLIYSCGSKRAAARKRHSKAKTEHVVISETPKDTGVITSVEPSSIEPVKITSTEQYLNMYSAIAQEEMRLYGIPASITLAQGILESNSGRGRLSVEANNHFGIKCHDWTGARVYHDDDKAQECFRKYKDAKYSYRDHSLFLTTRKRYAELFDLDKDDYKRWAKGLKAAGYATDRKYPDKLIALIERYKLYNLDDEVLNQTGKRKNKYVDPSLTEIATTKSNENDSTSEENVIEDKKDSTDIISRPSDKTQSKIATDSSTYTVQQGETLYAIAKKYNLTVEQLQDMNGLTDTAIKLGQQLKVKSQSESERITYTVEQGDTLYSISKKYNISVQALQLLNGLNDSTISIGQELVVK